MKRRDFIRLGGFLTVSAATVGLVGCHDSDSDSNVGGYADNPVRPMPAAAAGAAWQFPQSIASGDPKPDSIILWTRLLEASAAVTAAATTDNAITLMISSTSSNSANLGTNTALSDANVRTVTVATYHDFDGSARVKVTDLAPDTTYFYQFTAGTVRSNLGRFKTAPAATTTRDIKFAFMSCQDWSANHWGAYSQIVADDIATPAGLDFIVHLGDYIYETDTTAATDSVVKMAASDAFAATYTARISAGDSVAAATTAATAAAQAAAAAATSAAYRESVHGPIIFPNNGGKDIPAATGSTKVAGKYANSTADYRYLYKLYRSDTRIQKMHERFPIIAIWDDHEFSDDAWQTSGTYDNANTVEFARRKSANRAWFEYMPADIADLAENYIGFDDIKIYRDLKFGSTMHLVMTDERLYRQDHMIPETTIPPGGTTQLGSINTRYLAPEATMKLIESTIKDPATSTTAPLSLISILGQPQRDWWKSTMKNSTATWKVWGNEVSLLRMGLNGSNSLATLITLGYVPKIPTMVTSIAGLAATPLPNGTGGSVPAAAAIVGAVTFFMAPATAANQATAGAAAMAIRTSAMSGGDTAAKIKAGTDAGLTLPQATAAVAAFDAALAADAAGTTAAATAAAQTIVMVSIKSDIALNKKASVPFINAMAAADASGGLAAGTSAAKAGAFFQKFILNADQWDGYRKERTDLMNYLIDNSIKDVVAITGDIHAFFAGKVYNEFAGEVMGLTSVGTEDTAQTSTGKTAAMVDLVTAGNSSTSWFNYIKREVNSLDPTNSLLGKLVYVPIPVAALGTTFNLNLLDYSMGRAAPATTAELAAQLNGQIKRRLAAVGTAEAAIDATAAGVQAQIAASASFQAAFALAGQLAALGKDTNPWLTAGYIDTEAQGYAVVTASAGSLVCQFKKLNPLVGVTAPSAARIVASTKTATVSAGTVGVTIS